MNTNELARTLDELGDSEFIEELSYIIQNGYFNHIFTMLELLSPDCIRNYQTFGKHTIPKIIHTQCPHCNNLAYLDFRYQFDNLSIKLVGGYVKCNICEQDSTLILLSPEENSASGMKNFKELWISPPPKKEGIDLPEEVDDQDIRDDFKEAVLTLEISPRASAVLSRYCLQRIIRAKANIKKSSLHDEIEELIKSKTLPPELEDSIHAIRHIGNFAAHPSENNTGEIVEVERPEAEWLIEILKVLVDHYYVKPARIKAKKAELNEKLKSIGKKEML